MVVIMVAMRVMRVVMAIKTNGARVAWITAVVGGIAAGRQSVGLRTQQHKGLMSGGGSCVPIKERLSEGSPVGSNGRGGNKFHWAEKSCQHSRGTRRSVLL
uniref:Secreted protein n=1 Tax=Romanomermis culicivorax TaxID=13658 RepID=A0A915KYY5_ROMCU